MIRDIENSVKLYRENKYAFQIGLKDLDFDLDEDMLKVLGIDVPFHSISEAEEALRGGAIKPIQFIEDDCTEHQVLVFDQRPVGYSGFMNCVTHSLAMTNHGLFEVGRYPAMSLDTRGRYWQWFLHCRLASSEEVSSCMESQNITPEQFLENAYQAMTTG